MLCAVGSAWSNPIDSKIVRVRLYTDRAEVIWRINASVPAGTSSFTLSQLPSALIPGSVRVNQIQGLPVDLTNVKTDRVHGSQYASSEITQQEKIVKTLESSHFALVDEVGVIAQQLDFIASLVNPGSVEVTKSSDSGKEGTSVIPPEAWDIVLDLVSERGPELRSDLRLSKEKMNAASKELSAARKNLRELLVGARKLTYNVALEISSATPAKPVFEMVYQVNNTGWRPVYHFKGNTKKKKLFVEYYGEIYQRTGEDWTNVQLELSTGSPVLGARIPELEPWVVDFPKPSPSPVDEAISFAVKAPRGKVMPLEMNKSSEPLAVGVPVEDQGTAVLFKIPRKQNITSGASNHRARIARFALDMELTYRSVPKLSPYVYLSGEIKNLSDYHWLPGKGLVYVDGGFVGNNVIDFIATNQTLKLGLGVDKEIRIERILVKKEAALEGMFGKKNRLRFVYDIEIENFKEEPVILEVMDQLPLPYQQDIKVIENKIDPPPSNRDEKNILTWKVNLIPEVMETIRMDYQVEYPEGKDVTGLD